MLQFLRKLNTLKGFKRDIKNLTKGLLKLKRLVLIERYFNSHDITKLHLGSNSTIINGWLCSDIQPQNCQSIHLDVTKKFPFKDESFNYINCEHLIEHLDCSDGLFMLKECYRVLKKDGRLRISTPDLNTILRLYTCRSENYGADYIEWITNHFTGNSIKDPVIVVNTAFHNWGHRFLYDFDFLKVQLTKCGYTEVGRFSYSQSNDFNLQNIERHHENVGNLSMVQFETLLAEAVKAIKSPSCNCQLSP